MTALPRIGLTTYREKAAWGVWDEAADLLPATYADAVAAAGGVPILLPPTRRDEAAVRAALDGVHGLLIAGGADVDPARYDAGRDPQSGPARADRDEWESALVRLAIAARIPVLAICRGMQVLNVALGGTLHQHLPDVVGTDLHCPTTGVHGRHDVRLQAGALIHGVFGDCVAVATYHHQGVDRLGEGLIATGWADDGLVEAVELPGERWVVGVQWHPEVSGGPELFGAFVAATRGDT
jgi:gamma-glutamyl-gamma-aminobutyrate hydrolase PuuD